MAGFWCFVGAALTDAFDGMVARMRNEQTALGAYLDPIADKLLLMACFLTLAYTHTPLFRVPLWFAWFIVIKEVLLVCGVIVCYSWYGPVTMRPTILSKTTTLLQLCFIGWLFVCYFFNWALQEVCMNVLMIMATMVVGCFAQYARAGLRIGSEQ